MPHRGAVEMHCAAIYRCCGVKTGCEDFVVLEQGELEGFTVAKASGMLCEQCCGDCVS